MQFPLQRHPDTSSPASTVEVRVLRRGQARLELFFLVRGRIADLRLAAPAAPVRKDGLWQQTCFEAFIRAARPGPYYELNFSPSGEWAAYRLSAYRSGMREAAFPLPPVIATSADAHFLELRASLDISGFQDLPLDRPLLFGLSAVIEDVNGGKSYWALAHPPGQPDFHHEDCFAAQVPAAMRP